MTKIESDIYRCHDNCFYRIWDLRFDLIYDDFLPTKSTLILCFLNIQTYSPHFQIRCLSDVNGSCSESIILPCTFDGKFTVLPHFPPHHIFTSVQDILEIFPAITSVIMPRRSFYIKDKQVNAWEWLKVMDKVQTVNEKTIKQTNHNEQNVAGQACLLRFTNAVTLKQLCLVKHFHYILSPFVVFT